MGGGAYRILERLSLRKPDTQNANQQSRCVRGDFLLGSRAVVEDTQNLHIRVTDSHPDSPSHHL